MEDKKTGMVVKIVLLLVILGAAYPIYSLLDSTIQKKRKNAVKNADKKWAPDALLDCAWRYEVSLRDGKNGPIYEEWLKIYGGDVVCSLMFPDRFDEIEEFDGEDDHKFSPPRINTETPHAKTPVVLFTLAQIKVEQRNKTEALRIVNIACDAELFPAIPARTQSRIFKLKARLEN